MTRDPFADLPRTPAVHFRLWFYRAAVHLLDQVDAGCGGRAEAVARFPFLAGYAAEVGPAGAASEAWAAVVRDWEADTPGHLPVRALREVAGLDEEAALLWFTIGLGDEDARFGAVFELLAGGPGHARPTAALLRTWTADPEAARRHLRRLTDLGLVRVVNPDAPRAEWAYVVPAAVWDAARGDRSADPAPGLRYTPPDGLRPLDALILPDADRAVLTAIPRLAESGEVSALVVRGPRHGGRRTAVGAIARALGRGTLEVAAGPPDRWTAVGPLATLLNAVPVAVLDPAPGEAVEVPRPAGYRGPVGVVLGSHGGVTGPGVEPAVTLTLGIPAPTDRAEHWAQAFADIPAVDVADIAGRFRLPAGAIRRAAALARPHAALAGRPAVAAADVRAACRGLNRQALEAHATYVPAAGDRDVLAVPDDTRAELRHLAARCRHREGVYDRAGPALRGSASAGVRALLAGPSGTGKTLAARALAAELDRDLFRVDLHAVTHKFIGESEKSLHQLLSRCEEHDVVLLLDEGDALMTARTAVQTSVDRYANLETNFLLQRLESFAGIILVTTNAPDRIDPAFQRRMDVVVEFRPPDGPARLAIWGPTCRPTTPPTRPSFGRSPPGAR